MPPTYEQAKAARDRAADAALDQLCHQMADVLQTAALALVEEHPVLRIELSDEVCALSIEGAMRSVIRLVCEQADDHNACAATISSVRRAA